MNSSPLPGQDAAWLRMDRAINPMVVAGFFDLAPPASIDRVYEVIETRLLGHDRFRQRIVDRGTPGSPPRWENDPDFDLHRHVVVAKQRLPSDDVALRNVLGAMLSEPLDREHPLWRNDLFERTDGSLLVFSRVHHAIADGFALLHVLLSLCDRPDGGAVVAPTPAREPFVEQLAQSLRRPWKLPGLAGTAAAYAASAGRLVLLPPDPPTPLRVPLSGEKRLAWSSPIAVDLAKAISRAAGATLNDVLLACFATGLRRYLQSRGIASPPDVRAMVPVNLRSTEEARALGNYFGLVLPTLPVATDDPVESLDRVKRQMDRLKRSPEAFVALAILQGMGYVPRGVENLGVEFFAHKTSLVLTNVPGPRVPLRMAGSELKRMMFWVPQSDGLGVGVSIFSYAGSVLVGVMSDTACVPDPMILVEAFERAFDDLRARLQPPPAHASDERTPR